jgi:hypothetical protein
MAEPHISAPPEDSPTSNQRQMERVSHEPEITFVPFAEPESYTGPVSNNEASKRSSAIPHRQRGYRRLATFMAEVDDVVIFRKFQKLNILNLLRLQAELAALELSYEAACDSDDNSTNIKEQGFTQSFYELREHGNISPGSQLELLDRINETLAKYSTFEVWLESPC